MTGRLTRGALVLALSLGVVIAEPSGHAQSAAQSPDPHIPRSPHFDTHVLPILTSTCVRCHNERLLTAGLNLTRLTQPESIGTDRDLWEKVMDKLRAGEMPPKSAPPIPAEEMAAF